MNAANHAERRAVGGGAACFDLDYFATAFRTISSLAARCIDEPSTNSHDILWSIQELAERWAGEMRSKGGGDGQ